MNVGHFHLISHMWCLWLRYGFDQNYLIVFFFCRFLSDTKAFLTAADADLMFNCTRFFYLLSFVPVEDGEVDRPGPGLARLQAMVLLTVFN